MKRIMLIIAYDGTNYCGWQMQINGITIEEVLNKHLSKLLGEDIAVIGASRTDSGVHALGNVAVFDTNTRIPADKICFALNQRLPDDIAIQSSKEVPLDFHPRKCNSIKTYEYKILNRKMPIPLYRLNSHFVYMKLDIDKMKKAAVYLIGEHDFKSFSSSRSQIDDTVRTIYELKIDKVGDMIAIRITGNGFLYNMVRIIVGTLMKVGLNIYSPEYVEEILDSCDRSKSGAKAPAKGLTLINIEYPDKLEDSINIENKYMKYTVIQREIPYKKKAYILIKRCTNDKLLSVIERNTKHAIRNQAEEVYLTLDEKSIEILKDCCVDDTEKSKKEKIKDKTDEKNRYIDRKNISKEATVIENDKTNENIVQEFRVRDFIYRYYGEMIKLKKDISNIEYGNEFFKSEANNKFINNNLLNDKRDYRLEDFKMISLTKKNVESYISIFNESFYDVPNSKTYHAEAVLALNEDKNREFYIVAYNDQYVGTLEFEIKKIYKTGIIKAIAVKRNYQQKGFATILMQLALIHLKESGCHQIELIVSSINIKVKNLYEKFGFQNEEIISKWYVSTKKDYESLYYYKTSVGL